ncbi:MAG: hypothetical protein AAF242_11080 [Bacteroidota bacterium]
MRSFLIISLISLFTSLSFAQSNLFQISGNVSCESGSLLQGVEVYLLDAAGNHLDTSITDAAGVYVFDQLSTSISAFYQIQAKFPDFSPLNGVSTFDVVLITRHILGVGQALNAVQVAAGDVNQSGTLTTLDLVYLRLLILQISGTENLPPVDWLFYAEGSNDPTQAIEVSNLSADVVLNLKATKRGDINGSAICGQ